jgi:phage tail-like protein
MAPRTSQHDPYRTYKFRVRLDNAIIAGIQKVSPLGRNVAANEIKEAGDAFGSRYSPGMISYDEVTLQQGWSADTTFEKWANQVMALHNDPSSAKGFKRTLFIEVFDLNGTPATSDNAMVQRYKLHRAWVSKYVAMPDLDALNGGYGISSVTLRHEGWERL